MQSMKDWHVTRIESERINRKSGGQGVAKLYTLIKSKEQMLLTILKTIIIHKMVLYFSKNLDSILFASL